MGKVRPDHIKKLARELVERFPDRFTTDFENNKKWWMLSPMFRQQKLETE